MKTTEKLSDSIAGMIEGLLKDNNDLKRAKQVQEHQITLLENEKKKLIIKETALGGKLYDIKEILATPEIEVGNDADGIRQRKLEAISKILEG